LNVDASVIIPTLNDASTLAITIAAIDRAMGAAGIATEVLIVDAGSTDGTLETGAELADEFPLLHIRLLVQSGSYAEIGTVIRLGAAYANGRFGIIVLPGGQDPVELIPRLISELRGGADLVLVSRYEDGTTRGVTSRTYAIYQRMYRSAIRTLLRVDIPDSTYGFRAFNRTFVNALGLSSRRFSVFPEITFKVFLADGVITRVPGGPHEPTIRQQSKFRLRNELVAYAGTLLRAAMHRAGWHWF